MWVFDATPLIYLAKVNRLPLVQELGTSCVLPERVYEEVVTTGIEAGYPDARRIDRSVAADTLKLVMVPTTPTFSRLQENTNLSDADRAVIAYADSHDGIAVIDEQYGRDVATAEGVTTRGTLYLVLRLADRGVIDVDDARTVIDGMIDEGWYCSPELYRRIVQKLEVLSE